MKQGRRNVMVAIFVLLGIAVLGWLVFKFGDLPALIHRVDAEEIDIYFSEALGVQDNTDVMFCGFPVGKVVSVQPPKLLPNIHNELQQSYQVVVRVAIGTDHQIPNNVVPKFYRRGLGGSYLQLVIDPVNPGDAVLTEGDRLQGVVSEASEFISETTQRRLDNLVDSLTVLSDQLKEQLEPLPPEVVDVSDPNKIRANVTTTVMRMDEMFKNLNVLVGDPTTQKNFKKALADFSALSSESYAAIKEIRAFTEEAEKLLQKVSNTVGDTGKFVSQAQENLEKTGAKIQIAADEMAQAMQQMNQLLLKLSEGQGTAGRIVNDPRLYEALTDTTENLNLAITDIREQIALWREHGITYKEGKKIK